MPQLQIRKDAYATWRIVDGPTPALEEGEVRVKVDRFGYSANNITYAAMGDRLGYWQFFPPLGDDAEGWGTTPVWGFADVVESRTAQVPEGDRLFGYFPPADQLVLRPQRVTAAQLFDGAPHRAKLPPGYNSYRRVLAEPGYDRRHDASRMLLWPLHATSFVLWDYLKEREWFGARQLLVLSASSKTSIGLAYALHDDADAPTSIGLTAARNRAFVDGLGLYDQVLDYTRASELERAVPTLIVDMSGDAVVLAALQAHLGESICRCVQVGLTHWEGQTGAAHALAERSEFFFAPARIQQRIQEWGADAFGARSSAFIGKTARHSRGWMQIVELDGLAEFAAIYPQVCRGELPAEQGVIVRM